MLHSTREKKIKTFKVDPPPSGAPWATF